MPALKLTKAIALQTLAAIKNAGGSRTEAAKALGVPVSTVKSRIRIIARTFPDMPTPMAGHKGGHPVAAPRTLAEDVAHSRAQAEERGSKSRLKEALAELSALHDRIKDLEWAAKASPTPALWTMPNRIVKPSEHMPYLLTSDFQIGEVINKNETDHGYGYDTEIFRRRYRRMIDTTIYLSSKHAGASWKFPGIIYARGGDTISGAIHDELRQTDDLTPIQACEVAFEEESAGIYKLLDMFGRVDVKDAGGGNHDRTTFKPQSKKANANSFDRLISYMLRREFAKNSKVNFQCTESPDVFFPIYDMNILLTHGDRIGSRGGQGFIGPAATIMRGAQKVIMEQATIGRRVDRVDMGHFHSPMYLDWVICNGCLPGYSEFAKMFRMRPSTPQQYLLYHHPRRGVVDIKPIVLTEA